MYIKYLYSVINNINICVHDRTYQVHWVFSVWRQTSSNTWCEWLVIYKDLCVWHNIQWYMYNWECQILLLTMPICVYNGTYQEHWGFSVWRQTNSTIQAKLQFHFQWTPSTLNCSHRWEMTTYLSKLKSDLNLLTTEVPWTTIVWTHFSASACDIFCWH